MANPRPPQNPSAPAEQERQLMGAIKTGSYVQMMKRLFELAPVPIPPTIRDNPQLARMVKIEAQAAHLHNAVRNDASSTLGASISNIQQSLSLLQTRDTADLHNYYNKSYGQVAASREKLRGNREALEKDIREFIGDKNKRMEEIIHALVSNDKNPAEIASMLADLEGRISNANNGLDKRVRELVTSEKQLDGELKKLATQAYAAVPEGKRQLSRVEQQNIEQPSSPKLDE